MANSELYDKSFNIPNDILKGVNAALVSHPTGEGVKRAKSLLKNRTITYQSLKRLKNFFDYYNTNNGDKGQYDLAGGDMMRNFVESTLNANRAATKRSDDIKADVQNDLGSEVRPTQITRTNDLSEVEKKSNVKKTNLTENAIAVIVNDDNKMLLVKRGDGGGEDIWMPNKWSLVGGGIEEGETPEQACKREILEETSLKITKFTESFTIQRNNNVEHVFVCRYTGEPTDVTLDFENSAYGWYGVAEIDYLDIVPHLVEYLKIVFKDYEE
jgi:8-oxo-dGTP pyrophosphatase MutT (NUDIX family)